MRQPTFYDALNKIVGEGKTGGGSTDGPISEIIFLDGVTKPTDAEVKAKLAELQAAYDAQAYARNRAAEYPSIQELVVAIYDTNDRAAVDAKRAAVKAKFPKP